MGIFIKKESVFHCVLKLVFLARVKFYFFLLNGST